MELTKEIQNLIDNPTDWILIIGKSQKVSEMFNLFNGRDYKKSHNVESNLDPAEQIKLLDNLCNITLPHVMTTNSYYVLKKVALLCWSGKKKVTVLNYYDDTWYVEDLADGTPTCDIIDTSIALYTEEVFLAVPEHINQ